MNWMIVLTAATISDSVNVVSGQSVELNFMTQFSFFASILLVLLTITEITFRVFQRRDLSVMMTKEVFFRLLEAGEKLYVNLIYISNNVNSLITNICGTLSYTNLVSHTTKSCILELDRYGEKIRKTDGSFEFSFDTTSSLTYLLKDVPIYKTVVFAFSDNSSAIQSLFQSFRNEAFQEIDKYNNIMKIEKQEMEVFEKAIDYLIKIKAAEINNLIQIDTGAYELEIRITYKLKNKWFLKDTTKYASNKLSFSSANYSKISMNRMVEKYLYDIAMFYKDSNYNIVTPVYSPINVIESSS